MHPPTWFVLAHQHVTLYPLACVVVQLLMSKSTSNIGSSPPSLLLVLADLTEYCSTLIYHHPALFSQFCYVLPFVLVLPGSLPPSHIHTYAMLFNILLLPLSPAHEISPPAYTHLVLMPFHIPSHMPTHPTCVDCYSIPYAPNLRRLLFHPICPLFSMSLHRLFYHIVVMRQYHDCFSPAHAP